jgi:hypothetical protein
VGFVKYYDRSGQINLEVLSCCRVQNIVVRHKYYICLLHSVTLLEIRTEGSFLSRLINIFYVQRFPPERFWRPEKLWIHLMIEFAFGFESPAFLVQLESCQILLPHFWVDAIVIPGGYCDTFWAVGSFLKLLFHLSQL